MKELRDAYEQQMAENKAGFSAVYDKKIQDLQGKLAGERGSAAGAIQEMKEMRTRCYSRNTLLMSFRDAFLV